MRKVPFSGRGRCVALAVPLVAWLCSVAVVVGVMRVAGVPWPEAVVIAVCGIALAAVAYIATVMTERIGTWITEHATAAMAGRLLLWVLAVAVIVAVMVVGGFEVTVAIAVVTGAILVAGKVSRWVTRSGPGRTRTA